MSNLQTRMMSAVGGSLKWTALRGGKAGQLSYVLGRMRRLAASHMQAPDHALAVCLRPCLRPSR